MLHRLVRRQHVVVRGDDGQVAAGRAAQVRLVGAGGGEPVREVAAAQPGARRQRVARGLGRRAPVPRVAGAAVARVTVREVRDVALGRGPVRAWIVDPLILRARPDLSEGERFSAMWNVLMIFLRVHPRG